MTILTRSERIRQRTIAARTLRLLGRTPGLAMDVGEVLIDLHTLRNLAPFMALSFCVAGWWAAAIVAMLAGILAQLMIMEPKE